jgi:hypothetical protein
MKVYIRRADGTIEEVTKGNRRSHDPRDPGGQMGKFDQGQLDMRNLGVHIVDLQPGDVLLPMSDGIHDNLNPENLKISPRAAYDEILQSGTEKEKELLLQLFPDPAILGENDPSKIHEQWQDSKNPLLEGLQEMYMSYLIGSVDRERGETPLPQALTARAMKNGESIRKFLQNNPKGRVSEDVNAKCDHLSCGQIGDIPKKNAVPVRR